MVLDVLVLVPAVLILLASFQNNQRRKASRFLKFFFAFGIVLSLFAFNLFGVPSIILNYSNYATFIFNYIPATYRSVQYAGFYVFIIMLFLSLILYLLFSLFGLIFNRERKRMRDPLYAPKHHWYWGILIGILRAGFVTYIMILLVKFTTPLTQLDVSSSIIITMLDSFDPLYSKLVDVISALNVPWIV